MLLDQSVLASITQQLSQRQFQLGQPTQHVLARSLKSFIKGYQVTLRDFLSFLTNLRVNLCFCIASHKKEANMQLIITFLMTMVGATSKPKLLLWHENTIHIPLESSTITSHSSTK